MSLGDRPVVAPFPAAYDAGRRAAVSSTKLLAYALEPAVDTRVLWMDQAGNTQGTVNMPAGHDVAVAKQARRSRPIGLAFDLQHLAGRSRARRCGPSYPRKRGAMDLPSGRPAARAVRAYSGSRNCVPG